jgi:hypothetical protein
MLMALLPLTAGAVGIASILYWLMQPMVLPNPGLAAYQPPTPDPIVPRISSQAGRNDFDRAAVELAKRENELAGVRTPDVILGEASKREVKSAFAKARPSAKARPRPTRTDRVRTARPQPENWRTWAWGNSGWGTW